ncbi:MAG: hypothetical protein IJO90_05545, partial [Alistipes sp.]|nr:hypothetical protein [Alistipes sp.]
MRNFYLTFVLFLLVGCGREQVVTFAEAADPTPVSSEDAQAWEGVNRALNAGWGSADIAYSR